MGAGLLYRFCATQSHFEGPADCRTSGRDSTLFHATFPLLINSLLFSFGCRAYANLLQAKLPASQGAALQQQHLVDGGEVAVCYVVNTAEYCADILPQLEDMIK